MQDINIAVVGTGLIGSTLVCALQKSLPEAKIIWIGGPTAAVNAQYCTDARVIACSLGSKQLLDSLGVWQLIPKDRIGPYKQMRVWDYEGTGQVSFADEDTTEDLGYIIENSVLLEALHHKIDQGANAVERHIPEMVDGIEYQDSGRAILRLEKGAKIGVDLVCAADGADSSLRQWADLNAKSWSCDQRALTAVVRHSESHRQTAWQAFLPTGPLAFLPLAHPNDPNHCAIVWSIDLDRVEEIESLNDSDFIVQINRYLPAELGRVESVTKRFSFSLQQSLASQYFKNRILLVGDSAHNVHPLAGQGANLGFADIDQLIRQFKRAANRGEPLWGDSVLRRYQRQRRWQNNMMAASMDFFRRGFGLSEPHLRLARNQLMHLVQEQPKLKRALSSIAEKALD